MVTRRGDVSEAAVESARSWHYATGEQVRVDPVLRFVGETSDEAARRRALVGSGVLTVREVIVTADPYVLYAFHEVEGEHNARGFHDALGAAHDYGVALVVDGEPWLVPIDRQYDHDSPRVGGAPKRLDLDLDRFGRLNFPPEPGALLAELAGEAVEGEFDMVPLPGGDFRLRASAWRAPAEARLVEMASEAVVAHRDALGFQP